MAPKRPNRASLAFLTLGIVVIWLAGDFAHSQWVHARIERWEASVAWNADGVQQSAIAYETGRGRIALLLIHGFNDSPRAYHLMAPALAELGFAVRVSRLPGFGLRASDAQEWTYADWIQATVAEASALRMRFDKVVLVGHSLGGAVVIGVLRAEPDLADAAVLLAPAIAVADDRSPLLSARAWHRVASVALPFTDFFFSPFDRNDALNPAMRNPPEKPPFSSRVVVDQAFALMKANQTAAPLIKTPVLVALSNRDAVTDWRAAQRFYEELGSAYKKLEIVSSSAHALPEDNNWLEIVDAIGKFANTPELTSS